MKSIIIFISIGISVLSLYSCNDYLDTMPDNRTVINSSEELKELLVSAYPNGSYIAFCEAMSDNSGDKSKLAPIQDMENEQAYFWRDIPNNIEDTPAFYWNACYKAIAAANHALEAIETTPNSTMYDAYKGEALIARAYNHYMLVSLFAQRYNPVVANRILGVPYVTEPEKEVFKVYKRDTLKVVYDKIQKDLEEGLSLIKNDIYGAPKYHFTESAAYGFASRFYLTIGKWEEAILYANRVLGLTPEAYIRDWNMYNQLDYYDLKMIYTNSSETANILLSGAISVVGRYMAVYRFGMTTQVREQLFNAANVTGGKLLYKVFGRETSLNIPKLQEHFKLNSINSSTGVPFIMAPLITMEEVLFNRAEALVMLEKYEEAMDDINVFFSKRVQDYNANLHKVSINNFEDFYRYANPDIDPWFEVSKKQKIFLKGMMDIKRKEYAQEGMRWFDIKRYNIEVIRKDENGNIIDVLRKNDFRRAIQIPSSAISGGLEPNPR